ncbi:hypothetical protein BDA96_08G165900 [Sorghum bicolor]|uniref:Uncharacterized protein n=2 Tax=Sorghum bicolor TaxID=4558 RepID=A0A921QIM8_SORBI|nr:hypothetical protein BDA96_08G165900 [Sorghum bicolor]OQU79476.1 hypothetical protein SORBI_3008G149450 [Sorghum bicolor]
MEKMGDAREAIVEPAKGADFKHVLLWYLKLLCRSHPFERIKMCLWKSYCGISSTAKLEEFTHQ